MTDYAKLAEELVCEECHSHAHELSDALLACDRERREALRWEPIAAERGTRMDEIQARAEKAEAERDALLEAAKESEDFAELRTMRADVAEARSLLDDANDQITRLQEEARREVAEARSRLEEARELADRLHPGGVDAHIKRCLRRVLGESA